MEAVSNITALTLLPSVTTEDLFVEFDDNVNHFLKIGKKVDLLTTANLGRSFNGLNTLSVHGSLVLQSVAEFLFTVADYHVVGTLVDFDDLGNATTGISILKGGERYNYTVSFSFHYEFDNHGLFEGNGKVIGFTQDPTANRDVEVEEFISDLKLVGFKPTIVHMTS